ncbi:MAG: dehydrogenase [Chlamydiae bacterium CG10_big_fil_rev_8_21_14_0_10_42_34]|nr:MAG: dehydrogenase [Chlamydiae bacterium CG10_big_fil_rev_8_21_14_0_10_42_34]
MIFDAIIIGTGAGGGTMAHQLAHAGWNLLIIERGDFLPREKENWDAASVFQKGQYNCGETWIDQKGKPFEPGTHYFVGGNTKFYGAALLRLREKDFGEIEHYGGLSPAWPLKYQDFQPYYQKAEELFEVHGQRGEDPLEPPEKNPYPYPAVSHEPNIASIADKLKKEGLNPFHLPLGVRLNEKHKENSLCIRCDTCDGFPCLADAKSDAHHICINPILNLPNVKLLTKTKALKLIEKNGQITEVQTDQGNFQAKTFIVSCGAINSAALLLRSNVANSSDQVGRHYMCHNNSAIVALSKDKNPVIFQKTIGVNDFYFGADDSKYPLGHIQLLGKVKAGMLGADAPFFTPKFVLDWMADHAMGWWITSEDLPDPNNRVLIKDDQIHLHHYPTNMEAHERLLKKLKHILSVSGHRIHFPNSAYLAKQIPIAGVAHQVGTARFGHDPKTSVLDIHCRSHDINNLYVVDGSFFPSAGAVNPALTIIANALRVSDHLCQK